MKRYDVSVSFLVDAKDSEQAFRKLVLMLSKAEKLLEKEYPEVFVGHFIVDEPEEYQE